MEKVTSLFASDPMSTEVGQLIDRATNASLEGEDWALNMEICDIINQREEGAKDAVKAMKKKLQHNTGKNGHVIELTLTIAETCVKNCGSRLHAQIATRDFLDELVRVLNPKHNPSQTVQERVLSLIQSWADAFRGKHELKEVERVYQELRAKGVEFPAADLDRMAPIFTPARSVLAPPPQPPVQQNRQHSSSMTSARSPAPPSPVPSSGGLAAPQKAKLNRDLEAIRTNCSVLSDMLVNLRPGEEPPDDWQLMEELEATCREMQHRLLDLLSSGHVLDEGLVSEMLKLNDDLNGVFLRYERHTRARNQARGVISGNTTGVRSPDQTSPQRATGQYAAASSVPPILQPPQSQRVPATSNNTRGANNLIDFGNEGGAGNHGAASSQAESKPIDEREQLAALFSTSAAVSSEANAAPTATPNPYVTMPPLVSTTSPFTSPYRSTLPPLTVTGYDASGVPSISAGISTAVNARAAGIDLDQLEANLSDVEQWLKQRPSAGSPAQGNGTNAVPPPPPRAFERPAEPREDPNSPFGL